MATSIEVAVRKQPMANFARDTVVAVMVSLVDVTFNISLSCVLEAVFPAYSDEKNVWLGGLEGFLEVSLHVLFSSFFLRASSSLLNTGGKLVPYGALVGIFLLSNALRKLYALQRHLVEIVSSQVADKAKSSSE